ncbi:hypothetical protein ACOME3_003460 [Neoechinorhynchus agilis]
MAVFAGYPSQQIVPRQFQRGSSCGEFERRPLMDARYFANSGLNEYKWICRNSALPNEFTSKLKPCASNSGSSKKSSNSKLTGSRSGSSRTSNGGSSNHSSTVFDRTNMFNIGPRKSYDRNIEKLAH